MIAKIVKAFLAASIFTGIIVGFVAILHVFINVVPDALNGIIPNRIMPNPGTLFSVVFIIFLIIFIIALFADGETHDFPG